MIKIRGEYVTHTLDYDKLTDILYETIFHDDVMETFWHIFYKMSKYPKMRHIFEPIKWLFENQIPFTLEVEVKDTLDNSQYTIWYDQSLIFSIRFQNPRDEIFYKLKFV